jgi:uncharacterized protein YlxP (DUF503 family)
LKEKRGRLGAIMNRLRKDFNLSVAETDLQDSWQVAVVGCALISNDKCINQKVSGSLAAFVEAHFPDEPLIESRLEMV